MLTKPLHYWLALFAAILLDGFLLAKEGTFSGLSLWLIVYRLISTHLQPARSSPPTPALRIATSVASSWQPRSGHPLLLQPVSPPAAAGRTEWGTTELDPPYDPATSPQRAYVTNYQHLRQAWSAAELGTRWPADLLLQLDGHLARHGPSDCAVLLDEAGSTCLFEYSHSNCYGHYYRFTQPTWA